MDDIKKKIDHLQTIIAVLDINGTGEYLSEHGSSVDKVKENINKLKEELKATPDEFDKMKPGVRVYDIDSNHTGTVYGFGKGRSVKFRTNTGEEFIKGSVDLKLV